MQVSENRRRVKEFGEVFTSNKEITDMLDLIEHETFRIESRFLEPACGNGNFLIEVLRRKLNTITTRYSKSQLEFERYSIIAVSSLYGIDIQHQNVIDCRDRLNNFFTKLYSKFFKSKINHSLIKSIKYIIGKNILLGDALSFKTDKENDKPIIFSEWTSVSGGIIKRRDFTFQKLIGNIPENKEKFVSDLGRETFIPQPIKEYPLTHIFELWKNV